MILRGCHIFKLRKLCAIANVNPNITVEIISYYHSTLLRLRFFITSLKRLSVVIKEWVTI